MTTNENNLATKIIEEEFGDRAKLIVNLLIKKTRCSFLLIHKETQLDKALIAQILSALITHQLVNYNLNGKNTKEYYFNAKNVIFRLKHPQYIYNTKVLFGYTAELIVEEILLNGSLEQKDILSKVKTRIDALSLSIELNTIKESFDKLTDNNYLRKFISENVSKNNYSGYNSENVESHLKRKNIDEDDMLSSKIRKTDENLHENSKVYWCINYFKFDTILRNQIILNAFENRIDKFASSIIKAILSCSNEVSNETQFQSKPITSIDIQRIMKNDHQMDSNMVEKYLNVITQDSFNCVEKVGDFGNGAYIIDFKKAFDHLCKANLESFVKEKYGSKSLRILKVIIDKTQLEQKQIEDFAMIPSKECKELLYNMLNDNILGITELSKTADHAPSRTFYMLKVNIYENIKKLLDYTYKAIYNLMLRNQLEIKENKRLIDKKQKLDSIIETLKSEGAEEAEIEEYKDYMNSSEISQIKHIQDICNKIDISQLQLIETSFIYEYYFNFNVPYSRPVKK